MPLLVALASVLSVLPELINGSWHRERAVTCLSDCWFAIGPVLVLAWLAPGEPSLAHFGAYVAAFGAQFAFDLAWTILRDRLVDQIPYRTIIDGFVGTFRFDAILTPIAFVITLPAVEEPLILLTIGPLVWLLEILSRDRRERYTATLELQRAYRGTVMLLSDVVEFDDKYTADHSRSVVDLVHATADELGIDPAQRQELEFAALLHDVGKIAIPKEILNKPSALTASEFEVMKTHTIEGQFMLDRVGGLLARVGEIVRSCHERWDGSGYPDGLTGEEIPLESRIVFAADAYNAMTTDRPYRGALSQQQAINELRAGSGTQFDPRVIEALCVAVATTDATSSPAADEVRALLVHSSVDRAARRSRLTRPLATPSPPSSSAPLSACTETSQVPIVPMPAATSSSRTPISETSAPAQMKALPNAQAERASLIPKTRPASRSGTNAWMIWRSKTSSIPLPRPAIAKATSAAA